MLALSLLGSGLVAPPGAQASTRREAAPTETTIGVTDACDASDMTAPGAGGTPTFQVPCPGLAPLPPGAPASGTAAVGPAPSEPALAGSDWSIVSSPNAPAAEPSSTFNGVTCVSASDCWAVGYGLTGSAYQTLIEHWDGTSWTIVTSPNTNDMQLNILNDVTCVSASDCWAVGYASTGSAYETLIQRWDGASWSIVTSPNASATDVLNDVTCVSASDCWAVGYTHSSIAGASQTLIEHWDGTSWTIATSPSTSATQGNLLSGVTCGSASDCWAVGSASGGTLIERWDGTAWAIVTSPNRSGFSNGLSSVTCVSASDCWTVGASVNGNNWLTLIEHWDGAAWAIVSSPNKSALQMNSLGDVTCVSATDCRAVGGYYPGTTWQTLVQRWDGTSWTIVDSPSTGAPNQNFLSSMTCVAATDCQAVGSSWTGSSARTLVEHWDGTSWAIVAAPNTVSYNTNILSGVTCVSASDCWAVGHYYADSFGAARTLIEHWDGTAWTIVASPNASARDNFLSDVTCVSASDCWAVGYFFSDSAAQTLIQRWDGTSWAVVTSANTASSLNNFLSGVTCVSASDCWAVGTYFQGSPSRTLIEHWDGTEWALVASPNASSPSATRQRNTLSDVTCVSVSNCWAVGSYDVDSPAEPDDVLRPRTSRILIERWDGTSWAIVTSSDTLPIEQQSLTGVTCLSASDCWAVGHSLYDVAVNTTVGGLAAGGTARQTLIKRWDGSSWSTVSSPNTSATEHNSLSGVTCVSVSDCWVVGHSSIDGAPQTLIQQWDGTSWTAAASPNTGARDNFLSGVTCVSASDCWAVGNSHNGIIAQTLTARYTDEATPTPTPSPTPSESATPDPTPTETASPTPTESLSPSPSQSPGPETATVTFTERSATSGQYSDETLFEARLTDSSGDPIAGAELTFELAGADSARLFRATTDTEGIASVTPSLQDEPGAYQLTVRYAGDADHEGSADTNAFVIDKEDTHTALTVTGKGGNRRLEARLSDADNSSQGVAGRTIHFYSDGELLGTDATDADGIAGFDPAGKHQGGRHTYEARFEGDDHYRSSSDQEG